MKVEYRSNADTSDAAVLAATGRSWEEWFQELDHRGGASAGRKKLGDFLLKEKIDPWWTGTLLVEYERSRGVVEKDGRPKGYNVCVTKSVAAKPETVYAALADCGWWLGPRSKADVREGGSFDDGDGHTGEFRKLAVSRAIRFTWQGCGHQEGELVEIKLTASGAKTSVVLTHDRLPDRQAADGMRAVWGAILDELKGKLA
jgi:uncharacterized protein YndB with AHSA1/START domain